MKYSSTIQRFLKLIKLLLSKVTWWKKAPPPPGLAKTKPSRKWWEFPFKIINTSRGGINMPKYQPCPSCFAGAKRVEKFEIGASYKCHCGRQFMVTHPRQVFRR